MKKYLFILLFLSGCNSFGSNVKEQKTIDLKGSDKVDAAFTESRKIEAPIPPNVTMSGSGNSTVTYTPPVQVPVRTETVDTGRDLKSSAWVDQSISQVFEQHSGLFYLFGGLAVLLVVYAITLFEKTKTARAVFALGDMVNMVTRRLVDTDRGTEEHKALSQILNELTEKRRAIETKRK